jgi:hypothetical protein
VLGLYGEKSIICEVTAEAEEKVDLKTIDTDCAACEVRGEAEERTDDLSII